MSRADFVSQIYQAALAAGLTDAAARVTASQAAIESQYGEKAPGNNYFGIKAGKSWTGDKQLLTTHEVVNGKRVKVKDWFRSYPTPEEGVADRVQFMETRFPEFNKAPDVGTALDALQNGKYGKYFTADRGEYEGIVNYVNTKFLDGKPVPPGSVGAVASETDTVDTRGLQQQLAQRGFDPGKIDGISGPRTKAAIKAFQTANGLTADGIVGPRTMAALNSTAPREDTAGRVLGASAGNRAGLSVTPTLGWKNGEVDPATSAGNNIIPSTDYQAARNLGGAGDPRLQVLGQPKVAPVIAPSMADTRAEQRMRPTPQPVSPVGVMNAGGAAGAQNASSGVARPSVPVATVSPPPPASGGNFLGALGGGINFLGSKAQELGSTLGNTAVQAKDAVVTGAADMADKTVDAIIPQAMQSLKVRSAIIDPILARGFTDKPGYTIKDSPTKYGKTQAERQEAAAKRQALIDGKPYVPSTGVRSQTDTSPMPAMFTGTSTGRTYTVGKTYQSSRGPVIATANGFQPAGAATKPSAKQSRAERFSNLDSFGNII